MLGARDALSERAIDLTPLAYTTPLDRTYTCVFLAVILL